MDLRIVFMGTPDFAVPSLKVLLDNGYNVVGVVTATDKYGGRGKKKLLESPVKKFAVANGIKVLQPEKFRNETFLEELRSLKANLQIIVAFRMLPEVVWSMPEYGTFNLHGSLLPKYRGAAPIHWAVINGEKETGCTTFFIQHKIDTGDVLFRLKMPIGENETTGDVHDRMMELGAGLVLKTVQAIESDSYELQRQEDSLATKAPKLYHDTCKIDFNQPVEKVHDFIRGLSPWPAAWAMLGDLQLKILKTTKEVQEHDYCPGTLITDNKKILKVAAEGGFVVVHNLQLQGKKRMDTIAFLNGNELESGIELD
jgi:methionyl-tRNA formyltransferase